MKLKSKKGNMTITTSLFVVIISILVAFYCFTRYRIKIIADNARDSLTMTNLSVFKNINLDKLGEDEKTIIIKEPRQALDTYKEHLKYNFNLNSNYICNDPNNYVKGAVKIKDFIIYNVENDKVHIFKFNTNSNNFSETTANLGTIKTPRGNTVKNTTLYSNVEFNVDTIFNNQETVNINEDSDITNK